jgi:general secretion pathway protein F
MRVELKVVRARELPQVWVCDAFSEQDARRRAQAEGFMVLSASSQAGWRESLLASGSASLAAALPLFVEQLHSLLNAGLSLIESLQTLERSAQGAWRALLVRLIRQLQQGHALSHSLATDPVFPALLVALVRSAELTSDLPSAFARFLEHHRRITELKHRLTAVALYPVLLTVVGSLVMVFLLLVVMPRFARVFEGIQGELPWSARAMVSWAHLLQDHGTWVFTGIGLCLGSFAAAFVMPVARRGLVSSLLSWPWMQIRLRTYFLARWYRTSGLLVEGGIPLPQAISMASDVLPLALRESGHWVVRSMQDGLSPAQAYVKASMTTTVAEQLLLASERTGDMGVALCRIAEFHEAEVSRGLEKAMRIFEPLVMVVIGVGVGVVVVLMYLPIFELASAIQ